MPGAGLLRRVRPRPFAVTLIAVLALAAAGDVRAEAISFKGKTITLYLGGETGGQDAYARLLMRHFPRHVAGAPAMTLKQMPGAGTLRAANYMSEAAAKDGTAIGAVGGDTATAALFETSGVRFDPRRFVWIGSMSSEVGLVLAWRTVPIKTMEDLFHRELLVGGGGPTAANVVFPKVMNEVLGTRFRVMSGYKSVHDVALAIERGELEGTASYRYSGLIVRNPDWLDGHKVTVLLQGALRPHRRFPDVPVVTDLAKTDEQRAMLELVFAREEIGRPFLLPPGTAQPIGDTLRRAFDAAMTDPELLADAERAKLDLNNPMSGAEIEALIARLYDVPPEIVDKARDAAGDTAP